MTSECARNTQFLADTSQYCGLQMNQKPVSSVTLVSCHKERTTQQRSAALLTSFPFPSITHSSNRFSIASAAVSFLFMLANSSSNSLFFDSVAYSSELISLMAQKKLVERKNQQEYSDNFYEAQNYCCLPTPHFPQMTCFSHAMMH